MFQYAKIRKKTVIGKPMFHHRCIGMVRSLLVRYRLRFLFFSVGRWFLALLSGFDCRFCWWRFFG